MISRSVRPEAEQNADLEPKLMMLYPHHDSGNIPVLIRPYDSSFYEKLMINIKFSTMGKFYVCILGPIIEELIFRIIPFFILYNYNNSRLVISTLIFRLAHSLNYFGLKSRIYTDNLLIRRLLITQIFDTSMLGLFLLLEHYKHIEIPIIIHIVNNLIAIHI